MIELGPATENEMVLAFLRAEVDSPRFGRIYKQHLDRLRAFGITRQILLDSADLNSSRYNAQRAELLKAVRGFRNNALLFKGFPHDVKWRRIGLEREDWASVKYANYQTWVDLSGGTRAVADGAKNIDSLLVAEDANKNVRALVGELGKGKRYPDLIGISDNADGIILVEGHSRATAYALFELTEPVQCILGSSPNARNWYFY